jgi:cholesterol transport system auxiliary component
VAGAIVNVLMRAGALSTLAVALSACAVLFPGKPPETFDLRAPSNLTTRPGALRGVLVVATPTAIQALDSQRIVARSAGGQISYVPDAQWSDRLTSLVQARMIDAYENAGQLRAVGRPGDRLNADYDLLSNIRNFGIDAAAGPPAAVVDIAVRIVDDHAGRVVAGKVFTARVPVGAVTGPAATAGLQQALKIVLDELVRWTVARV